MPPVLDPSGFMLSVVIIGSDGTRYPLWTRGASTSEDRSIFRNETVPFKDLPIVQSVSVDLNRGLNGSVSVEIGAPFDLGLELLNSDLFVIGNGIEVRIGYPRLGRFLPWFRTMAVKPDVTIDASEGLTGTLNGQGGAFAAQRTEASRSFTGSYYDAMREIARVHKWLIRPPEEDPKVNRDNDPLYQKRGQFTQGNRSDWVFVQLLARQSQCEAFIAPDPEGQRNTALVVRRTRTGQLAPPRYTFLLRGAPDFIKSFPIFSFQSAAEGVWLPRGNGQVRTNDVDQDNPSEDGEVTVNPDDVARSNESGVTQGQVELDGEESELLTEEETPEQAGERVPASARGTQTPREVAETHALEEAMRGGLNVTIETIGIPELFPGDVVSLAGAGIFNGNYGVDGVSHEASGDGWTMSLKLISNAMNARAVSERLRRQWQSFNRENAPQTTSDADSGGEVEREPEEA